MMLPGDFSPLARQLEQDRAGRTLRATSAPIIKCFADCDIQANISDVMATC